MKKYSQYIASSIVLFFFSLFGRGDSYPDLTTIDDLLNDKFAQNRFYHALRERFRNNNFEERLIVNDVPVGKRLDSRTYDGWLETLNRYFTQFPEEKAKLREIGPIQQPFQVSEDGKVHSPSVEELATWSQIVPTLNQAIASFKETSFLYVLGEEARDRVRRDVTSALGREIPSTLPWDAKSADAVIEALVKEYNRKKTKEVKSVLVDALLARQFADAREEKLRTLKIPAYAQRLILDKALEEVRKMKIPNLGDRFLEGNIEQSRFGQLSTGTRLGSGFTVLPMTRLESIFKGVGPGECVRASCVRYLDALFEDAFHLKVLKDGKETGYIGIYRVKTKDGKWHYWLLETVQSPFLTDSKGKGVLFPILSEIQKHAIREGVLVAIPARSESYNMYNYKEVQEAFNEEGLIDNSNFEMNKVELEHPKDMRRMKAFANSKDARFDQELRSRANYGGNIMTNYLEVHGDPVVALPPTEYTPTENLWEMYQFVHFGKKGEGIPKPNLDEVDRKILLHVLGANYYKDEKGTEARIAQTTDPDLKTLYINSRMHVLPLEVRALPFKGQLEYVAHRVARVQQTASHAQKLKSEILSKAENWEDFRSVYLLGDKGENRDTEYIKVMLEHFPRFSKGATDAQLLDFYQTALAHTGSDAMDDKLTRAVESGISAKGYLKLVRYALGKGVKGSFSDERSRAEFFRDTAPKHFANLDSIADRKTLFRDVLNHCSNEIDLHVREKFLQATRHLNEIGILGASANSHFPSQSERNRLELMNLENTLRIIDAFPENPKGLSDLVPLMPKFTEESRRKIYLKLLEKGISDQFAKLEKIERYPSIVRPFVSCWELIKEKIGRFPLSPTGPAAR